MKLVDYKVFILLIGVSCLGCQKKSSNKEVPVKPEIADNRATENGDQATDLVAPDKDSGADELSQGDQPDAQVIGDGGAGVTEEQPGSEVHVDDQSPEDLSPDSEPGTDAVSAVEIYPKKIPQSDIIREYALSIKLAQHIWLPSSWMKDIPTYTCGDKPSETCLLTRSIVDKARFAWLRSKIATVPPKKLADLVFDFIQSRQGMDIPTSDYSPPTDQERLKNELYFSDDVQFFQDVTIDYPIEICSPDSPASCLQRERCDKALYYVVDFGLTKTYEEIIDYLLKNEAPIFVDPSDPRKGIKSWQSCSHAAATYGDLYDWDIGGLTLILKPNASIITVLYRCDRARYFAWAHGLVNQDDFNMYRRAEWGPEFNDFDHPEKGVRGWSRCASNDPDYYGSLFDDI